MGKEAIKLTHVFLWRLRSCPMATMALGRMKMMQMED